MGDLIQFPTGKKIENEEENFQLMVNTLVDESVSTAQHMLDVMEDELSSMNIPWLEGFNMRDEQFPESRDAFVLVNIIYAMFLRYTEVPHSLHSELDLLYVNIKRMAQEPKNEVEFEPDFTLDGDDDDTT